MSHDFSFVLDTHVHCGTINIAWLTGNALLGIVVIKLVAGTCFTGIFILDEISLIWTEHTFLASYIVVGFPGA